MTGRRRKPTTTKSPIENHEHLPDSQANPVLPTESTVPSPQLRRVVGVGLFAVATVLLVGLISPSTSLPSSLGALAALSLALGTLLVGTTTAGRGEAESTVQELPTNDEETRTK